MYNIELKVFFVENPEAKVYPDFPGFSLLLRLIEQPLHIRLSRERA